MTEQTWMTLDQIAGKLRLPKGYIRTLASQKCLVYIGNGENRRYLDPTPEYSQKLRLAAIVHGKMTYVPPDLDELFLLTAREIAVICGWSFSHTKNHFARHPELPRLKVSPILTLYPLKVVRDILWSRQGRKISKQMSPFLLLELVKFFQQHHAANCEGMPTDEQILADEGMIKKLEALLRRSERDREMGKLDLARKLDLAKRVVQILESAPKPCSQPEQSTPALTESEPPQ